MTLLGGGKMLLKAIRFVFHSCISPETFAPINGEVRRQLSCFRSSTHLEKTRVGIRHLAVGNLPRALIFCFIAAMSLSMACVISNNSNFAETFSEFGIYFLAAGVFGEFLLALKQIRKGENAD
jgi:hypothetical protein